MSSITHETFSGSTETLASRIRSKLSEFVSPLVVSRPVVPVETVPQIMTPYETLQALDDLTYIARTSKSAELFADDADRLTAPVIEALEKDSQRRAKSEFTRPNFEVGTHTVWAAAHASDTFHTPATDELLERTISGLPAETIAKPTLLRAYYFAKENGLPFSAAFDELSNKRS